MDKKLNSYFKRITSSGKFIPEIDGLRFIAIISVVIFHLFLFITNKDFHVYNDNTDYFLLKKIASHGKLGVPLFFIISGFILGLPFAKFYIANGNKINIKSYFSRRLTRLEPPYILVMFLLFIGSVYIVRNLEFADAFKSLLASLSYTHNFFYPGEYPLLNVSAWSLEIEVQFYILAPILALFFSIKKVSIRRLSMICLIIVLIIYNHYCHLSFLSLINYLHYFLIGFLLVDIFLIQKIFLPRTKFDNIICLMLFVSIWLFESDDYESSVALGLEFLQISLIFFFYYYVLIHNAFKFLTNPIVTNIGGMCYSIYLLHYAIISMFGNQLLKYQISSYSFLNVSFYILILLIFILLISSIFYLLVEKPCMNKNWLLYLKKKTKEI